MFLFSSIRRLYFIQFLSEIYMEKVLQELFGVPFLGHPYRSNGTKIHLDMTLFPEFSLIFFQKFTFSLSFLNFPEIFHKSLPGFSRFFQVCLNSVKELDIAYELNKSSNFLSLVMLTSSLWQQLANRVPITNI